MHLNPYLLFNGSCEEAFKFYAKTMGGAIKTMMPFEGSPMEQHAPEEWRKKIMHATLDLGGQVLMGSDARGEHYHKPQGFSVTLSVAKPEEAERIFAALSEGGDVRMPLQETFWAARFGMATGKLVWERSLAATHTEPTGRLQSGASLSGGRLIVYGPCAAVIDAATGEVDWSLDPERVRGFPVRLTEPADKTPARTPAPGANAFYTMPFVHGGYGYGGARMQPARNYVDYKNRYLSEGHGQEVER